MEAFKRYSSINQDSNSRGANNPKALFQLIVSISSSSKFRDVNKNGNFFCFQFSLPFIVSNRWDFLDQQSVPWVYFKLWLNGGEDCPLFFG